ncbi:addiction module protein [Nitrospira sp. NS4]|uniref:addiction module protein n=1 Tax=Nitrospira sp. NS4 TaxID=3414498 RepID=UPI003C30B593
MAKTLPSPPPEFDKLPVAEQIDYVQALWDRIAASPDQIPVPEWHTRVIRERLEAYQMNPTPGRLWADLRKDIEQKIRDR